MSFRIAALLLATMATATATTSSSKAYRLFSIPPRPKAGKAFNSTSSDSEGSFVSAKASKTEGFSVSSLSLYSSKTGKMIKAAKGVKCDQSMSLSASTIEGNSTFSDSLSMNSKAAKSKTSKCTLMSFSMDIETAMPTYLPTYIPTAEPTDTPTTRRPTQRMVCQSGDFVDALGRDCFWYEDPNIELGCESLRDESTDIDLAVDGKTPWDECCFCGGGTMVPEPEDLEDQRERNLQVLKELISVSGEASDFTESIVCISGRDFVDPLGRDCSFYVPENIEQGCDSLRGKDDSVNEFPWMNEEGLTPWSECCFCGGGTLGYESALAEKSSAY